MRYYQFIVFPILYTLFFFQPKAPSIAATIESKKSKTATIKKVTASGQENRFTFNVTLKSPDKGCNQYANWWEIVSLEGDLVYRRILAHSHVNEQPFTRSGGKVAIKKDTEVIIRAHMNTSSYGQEAMQGSVEEGFTSVTLEKDFALHLEKQAPLPQGCAF